jgi:hypothetical protein
VPQAGHLALSCVSQQKVFRGRLGDGHTSIYENFPKQVYRSRDITAPGSVVSAVDL